MKPIREIIAGSIRFSLVSWVLCGIIYPLAATALAQALFPFRANGSLIRNSDGVVIGSALVGQNWSGPQWFHGRPSATPAKPYNASSSGGSNLGPTSKELWQRLSTDRERLDLAQPKLRVQKLPADMLTTSASGLDPDITVANALIQAPRVAAARGISVKKLTELIAKHVTGRDLGLFGEPRVNVLELNLVLDQNFPTAPIMQE